MSKAVLKTGVVQSQWALKVSNFIDYCMVFYGKGGTYDIGATREELQKALGIRLERYPHIGFDGDTLDREKVRDILLDEVRSPLTNQA